MSKRRILLFTVILALLTACGGTQDAATSAGGGTDRPAASADGDASDSGHMDEPTSRGGAHMDDHAGAAPADFTFGRPGDAGRRPRAVFGARGGARAAAGSPCTAGRTRAAISWVWGSEPRSVGAGTVRASLASRRRRAPPRWS